MGEGLPSPFPCIENSPLRVALIINICARRCRILWLVLRGSSWRHSFIPSVPFRYSWRHSWHHFCTSRASWRHFWRHSGHLGDTFGVIGGVLVAFSATCGSPWAVLVSFLASFGQSWAVLVTFLASCGPHWAILVASGASFGPS